MLGLAALGPRSLEDGSPLDVAETIEQSERHPFRKIAASGVGHSSAANRLIALGAGPALSEVVAAIPRATKRRSPVLDSHAISPAAAAALEAGDTASFVALRAGDVELAVAALSDRLAAWDQTDRPSIEYLLEKAKG
jgi:hypothetical protein